jgi:hypothetical protein
MNTQGDFWIRNIQLGDIFLFILASLIGGGLALLLYLLLVGRPDVQIIHTRERVHYYAQADVPPMSKPDSATIFPVPAAHPVIAPGR